MINVKITTKDKPSSCPYLYTCEVSVTGDYFGRICNNPAYAKCHHYARRTETLKIPMMWLQKQAIDHSMGLESKKVSTQSL